MSSQTETRDQPRTDEIADAVYEYVRNGAPNPFEADADALDEDVLAARPAPTEEHGR